jgi:hypothetical protein
MCIVFYTSPFVIQSSYYAYGNEVPGILNFETLKMQPHLAEKKSSCPYQESNPDCPCYNVCIYDYTNDTFVISKFIVLYMSDLNSIIVKSKTVLVTGRGGL